VLPEGVAGFTEQRVMSVLHVGVIPRDGQLLRQAAQRARAVDLELAGTVRVQSLYGVLDLRHHTRDLGHHLMVG
jgi:hypothetical protein